MTSSNEKKDFTDKQYTVYNDDTRSPDLRCPGCHNASFIIYRQNIENEKTGEGFWCSLLFY
jgi:hypothetical protein